MAADAAVKGLRWRSWLALGALLLLLVAPVAFGLYWYASAGRTLGAFADLWNTTDAIGMYVDQKHKWPRDWSALGPYLSSVGGDISNGVADRVDVNFRVDLAKSPEPTEWYVHLKSDGLPVEERAMNESLYGQRLRLTSIRRSRDSRGKLARVCAPRIETESNQ
jgi:hypothetical protein